MTWNGIQIPSETTVQYFFLTIFYDVNISEHWFSVDNNSQTICLFNLCFEEKMIKQLDQILKSVTWRIGNEIHSYL